ncbi:MAG: ABC transporter ATP-binding protein [Bdellovibrionales bacterium]
MNLDTVVQVKNLVKKYGDFVAVNGISLNIQKGECFGILGPNGAGKSSLLRILYGSSQLTSGDVFILGLNVHNHMSEIKSRIGVVPQDDGLDTDLTVFENLKIFGQFYDLDEKVISEKTDQLLRLMKIEDKADRAVDTLSGGMKRRLAVARGLINSPEILFLDEPTTGLDPQARRWIWDFFKELKSQNSTLVLTTHYMEEAEFLCDRIAIVDHGKILALGTPAELIYEQIGREVVEFDAKTSDLNYYVQKLKAQNFEYQVYHQTVHIFIKDDQSAKDVIQLFSSDRIMIRKPTLNDVFLRLSGSQLRDES